MTGKRKSIKQIAFYVFVAALVLILLIPIIWAILLSFKTNNEIVNTPLSFPTSWNFENYVRALETIDFGGMYFNTLILVLVSTFFSIVITFMSSFAIALSLIHIWKNQYLKY